MLRGIFAISAALILAACQTTNDQGYEAAKRGDCATAKQLWQRAANNGDAMAVNNLGVAAENCDRDISRAVGYYTLAARLGVPLARNNLVRLGQPVPSPDLQRQARASGVDPAVTALGLQLLNAGRPSPPAAALSPTVNCTTTHYINQSVTNCR